VGLSFTSIMQPLSSVPKMPNQTAAAAGPECVRVRLDYRIQYAGRASLNGLPTAVQYSGRLWLEVRVM
jgi:hypothetical protein